jgi:hypothetical protein
MKVQIAIKDGFIPVAPIAVYGNFAVTRALVKSEPPEFSPWACVVTHIPTGRTCRPECHEEVAHKYAMLLNESDLDWADDDPSAFSDSAYREEARALWKQALASPLEESK